MNETNLIILAAVILCALLLRLLVSDGRASREQDLAAPIGPSDVQALPAAKHYVYFPQISRALSAADAEYLRKNAPADVARKALRERRAIARQFLSGLREDFSALAKMGRVIAALSPEVSHKQETERIILSLRFQAVYALVWMRLWSGSLPLHQLEVLAGLIGRLSIRIDEAMTEISALSAHQLAGKLGA
jgi:hypothetical protein